ncbi:hypothetical protein NQ314_007551 [Rhamnusium bicolor]|uniref:Uncharacterized protein n=1 Tax=Rhamnusium bicolor TaxID=1586634 RepID=A0AAV8YP10_9CUCU|nr:hypothetical protein NQ314_007551 [Rhamnusium bicolor]
MFVTNLSRSLQFEAHSCHVTPTVERAITYDEESWKPSPEEKSKEKADFNRRSASLEVSTTSGDTSVTSSWYLENQIEENLNECEINELEEVFEDAHVSLNLGDCSGIFQVANIIEVKGPNVSNNDDEKGKEAIKIKDGCNNKDTVQEIDKSDVSVSSESETTSPNLKELQEKEEGEVCEIGLEVTKKDVEIEVPLKLVSNRLDIPAYLGNCLIK